MKAIQSLSITPVFAAGITILFLGFSACSKKEETVESAPELSEPVMEAPVEESKPAPKVVEKPKAPEPKPAPKPVPVPAPTGGAIAKQVQGHWAVDETVMLNMMKEQMAAEAGGGQLDPAMEQMATQMVQNIAKGLMLVLRDDGTGTMNTPGGPEEATYKISNANKATGEFMIEVDPDDDDPSAGQGQISGDKMTFTIDGQPLAFYRISADDYVKRQAESGQAMQDLMRGVQEQLQRALPEGIELPEGVELPEGIELPPGVQIPGAE
ncbi:MAG: hypothetical protein AAGJ79_02460 [Verrucomicrobiota bacterium]